MVTPADPSFNPAAVGDRILLVEDSEDDVFLFRRLLRKAGVAATLDIVMDGNTAIEWLAERVRHADAETALPRAIFIDLKLPGVLGTEVLRWIRTQPALDRTLAAICSSSGEPRDVSEAERLGAHVYLMKYPTPERLAALLAAPDPRRLPVELTAYVPAR